MYRTNVQPTFGNCNESVRAVTKTTCVTGARIAKKGPPVSGLHVHSSSNWDFVAHVDLFGFDAKGRRSDAHGRASLSIRALLARITQQMTPEKWRSPTRVYLQGKGKRCTLYLVLERRSSFDHVIAAKGATLAEGPGEDSDVTSANQCRFTKLPMHKEIH